MIFHQPHNSLGNYNYNINTYCDLRYTPHFHKNYEIIYVLEGSTSASVGGRKYQLLQGDLAVVLSNQVHSFSVPHDSQTVVIVFAEEFVPKFASLIKGLQGECAVFHLGNTVFNLMKENLIDKKGSLFMKKACFYAICDEYLASTELRNRQDSKDEAVVNILDWVSQHYTENISLKDVANTFGYEYHYLSRLLNKNYSINFTQLVNGYRAEKALELLQETDLPITEIVFMSGFQSIRNFNLVFKNLFGKNPKDYRQ